MNTVLQRRPELATRMTIYRSFRALRPRNPKKSYKESFWGSAKSAPKYPKKEKLPQIGLLGVFFDFGYFRRPFCRLPKRVFTPVNGRSDRNPEPTEHSSILCGGKIAGRDLIGFEPSVQDGLQPQYAQQVSPTRPELNQDHDAIASCI